MEDFAARLSLREALELYLFLEGREADLPTSAAGLFAELRAYLYDRLSIEEMEAPESLLCRLDKEGR